VETRITEKTIRKCYRLAGISSRVKEGVDVTEVEDNVDDDDDDLPLSEWVRKVDCGVLGQYDYDAYATIDDDDIVMAEAQTDEEIVREMRSKDGKEAEEPEEEDKEEEEEEKLELSVPTLSEALEVIRTLNRFYEATAGNSKKLSQIVDIEEHLENEYW
jgi:hypothetical protein